MPAPEPAPSFLARPGPGKLGAAAVIAIAAIAAYGNSFSIPFFFDDRAVVTDNPTIRHLFRLGTVLVPPASSGAGGRPLFNVSFALNYALGGTNPWGYHAFNLVVHILAALTLFGIARRTLRRASAEAAAKADNLAPFAIALLWTVHPLQTEAVSYVAERAESLMGLFYLLTLYCFIRYTDADSNGIFTGRSGRPGSKPLGSSDDSHPSEHSHMGLLPDLPDLPVKKTTAPQPLPDLPVKKNNSTTAASRSSCKNALVFSVLSVLCCLLGVATKEVVATAPIAVLLYDRTFVSGTFRAAWKRHWPVYLGFAASWALLARLVATLRQTGVGFDMGGGTWWDYALMESRALATYLGLAVWPHPLIFDYGMGVRNPGWSVLPDVLAIAALLAAVLWALFSGVGANSGNIPAKRKFGYAGAWFFLVLAPSSSVIAVAGQPVAEHRMYLPLAAVIAAVVGAIAHIFRGGAARPETLGNAVRVADAKSVSGRAAPPILASIAVLALLGLTIARNRAYASEGSLWRDVIAKRPGNPRARNGLGLVLAGEGDLGGAIGLYRQALRIDPDYAEAHENLAAALQAQGRIPEAVAQCEEFVRLRPRKAESHYDLGVALQLDDRGGEAVAQFSRALELRPDYPEAENNLGLSLVGLGRYAEAGAHFAKAVRLAPNNPDMRLNLGSAEYSAGDVAGAVREMREAVRLDPGFAAAHYSLGVALRRLGREGEAEAEFDQARRLGQK